nr:Chorismate synthase [Pandoravirus belohorizontensis]
MLPGDRVGVTLAPRSVPWVGSSVSAAFVGIRRPIACGKKKRPNKKNGVLLRPVHPVLAAAAVPALGSATQRGLAGGSCVFFFIFFCAFWRAPFVCLLIGRTKRSPRRRRGLRCRAVTNPGDSAATAPRWSASCRGISFFCYCYFWTQQRQRRFAFSLLVLFLPTDMSTFGRAFRVTTFGESHGAGVGCIIDGVPPCMPLTEADIQPQLDRRRPGQGALSTPRNEPDRIVIQSGTENGLTLGSPIGLFVANRDQRPVDYSDMCKVPRPSHADYTYVAKYGIKASSGGGRSSARETLMRVAAGAVAEKWLGLKVRALLLSLLPFP